MCIRDSYSVHHEPATWIRHLESAGLTLVDHYYRPAGLPREAQPWLATVARRPA